jgi:hypothetical protein
MSNKVKRLWLVVMPEEQSISKKGQKESWDRLYDYYEEYDLLEKDLTKES